jgi:hypothetical protein
VVVMVAIIAVHIIAEEHQVGGIFMRMSVLGSSSETSCDDFRF